MKFSEHERNYQLLYPDHSRYHYINLHIKLPTFATSLVHYMKLIALINTIRQKNMLISVISDINQVMHPKMSHQICIFQLGSTDWYL